MDGPSQRLQRQFWDGFFSEHIFNLGALNADSHEDNAWCINSTYIRWCVYESNLFGDPHTRLRGGLEGPYLSVVASILDDSSGDGDGLLNPGDEVGVTLTVQNVGTEPVYGAQAELTTADPMLSIAAPATLPLGDLAPGETAQVEYTVTISASCPTPHTFALTLNMTDNAAGAWSSDISEPIVRTSHISVSPTELSQTLEMDGSASQVVTVTNGTSAEEALTWNASVAPPGYDVSDSDTAGGPVYNWQDISGTGTQITGFGDDTNVGPFDIGFSFPFYDGSFSTFRVCSNGWLSFTSTSTAYSHRSLPSTSAPENLVAFFWDDLDFRNGGAAYYQRVDPDTLVVQFENVPYYGSTTNRVTCQALLKSDGSIIFQYQRVDVATGCTVGIQDATQAKGVQVAYNQTYVQPNLAVQLTPQTPWLTVAPTSGSTPVGASFPIDATFDATGLEAGTYNSSILINSNDLQNPLVVIPVTLTVVPTQPPAAPSDLAASPASASRIDLTWTDNANNETGFKLERKTGSGGTWLQIATPAANATSYSDTGLTASTTYVYRICATNALGDSDWSNEANATTPSGPPVAGYSRWFDASLITGVADGGSVSMWADLSGNNANATVPSGNAAPVYVADAGTGTGLGALYFARNSGPSNSAALRFASDGNIRTVFAVFKGSSFLLTAASSYHFHRPGDTNAADPLWHSTHASANIKNGATYVNGTQVNGTAFAMPTNLHNGFNLVEVVTT